MPGILAYGSYLPYYRLARSEIGAALGTTAGPGARAVAGYDEDTTSMAVEAGRAALAAAGPDSAPEVVYFATADPAYADKTNATAIHAALGLDQAALAVDMAGAVRSGVGALRAGLDAAGAGRVALVLLSDVRGGLPGSGDETGGGDGAAALLLGDGPGVVAEPVAAASATAEFLDRWRLPGQSSSHVWEERFGEQAYLPLAEAAVTDALKAAGLTAEALDHVIVAGTHPRAARRLSASLGARAEALVADEVTPAVGSTGTAQGPLALAATMDRARPGQVIAVITLADGADVQLWRTTEALTAYQNGRRRVTVADQLASGQGQVSYPTFLTWRGQLRREPPRRPDPEAPSAPVSHRHEDWKFAFTASRCVACGARHLPPSRVCVKCHAVDQMVPERLADVPGTVVTFTVDRLAFSLSPPVVVVVVDFDQGGRLQCEMTDVDPTKVKVGDRVEMTFRRLFTAGDVHNYFWKARPLAAAVEKGA
ncbi:MAG TPA: OB-fold domain-containing protein [Acidimicrobiales bacterium]|nr:MAG: hydroxymethylglutaryl-CoA synthase family protein [Actinomycetota bacterium]HMC39558.1 OB-fold domain-containing protein [Acidimicrobiales bacterium]